MLGHAHPQLAPYLGLLLVEVGAGVLVGDAIGVGEGAGWDLGVGVVMGVGGRVTVGRGMMRGRGACGQTEGGGHDGRSKEDLQKQTNKQLIFHPCISSMKYHA